MSYERITHQPDARGGRSAPPGFGRAVSQPVFLMSPAGTLALVPGSYVVGRADAADIRFPDDQLLSRVHARILINEDGIEVEDLGSSNGTLVGSVLVQHRLRVPIGSRLRFGSQDFVVVRALPHPLPPDLKPTAPEVPSALRRPTPMDEHAGDRPTSERDPVELILVEIEEALRQDRALDARDAMEPLMKLIRHGHRQLSPNALDRVSVLALRVALGTGDAAYADWVVQLSLQYEVPLLGELAEWLEEVASELEDLDRRALRAYLAFAHVHAAEWGPGVADCCDRIETAAQNRGTTLPAPPGDAT